MSDVAKEAWRKYLIQLQAHPLRTKAITAGVLAGFSDAVAQKISGIKKLQLRRLLLIMVFYEILINKFKIPDLLSVGSGLIFPRRVELKKEHKFMASSLT
uniref:Uncharacterized protein MANES_15G043600 n=1 Tax=Rhizophora mucronata TaxID=61149 RepID=A0A2P2K0L3_RHIMU